MRNALIVLCVVAAQALTANVASAQSKPKPQPKPAAKSAYQALNDAAVVKDMRDLGMKELLAGLASEDAKDKDLPKLMAAITATLAEAGSIPDPEVRAPVLDRGMSLMKLAKPMTEEAAAKDGASIRARMDVIRLGLMMANAQGILRSEPHAQQILYLLGSDADRKAILEYTPAARKEVATLTKEIGEAQSRLTGDDNILGGQRIVSALAAEARYNEARMLLYEGIATPTDAAGLKIRASLLPQAITMVSEWVAAPGAAGGKGKATVGAGIRQESLLLSGIASRELKEPDKAKGYFEQLLDPTVPPAKQAQALFEMAHAVVDQGKLEPGLAAIKTFQEAIATGKLLKGVGIDMQSTVLTSHLYDNLAAADASKAKEYTSKSAQVLLDFIKKHPDYTQAFIKIIKRKFQGQDQAALPVGLKIMLTDDDSEAEKIKGLEAIVSSPEAKTPAELVEALMRLADCYKKAGRLGLAAARYRRVAEECPKEAVAPEAAVMAVECLRPGVSDSETFKPGSAEFQEYTRCLEVLLGTWAGKDNRDYYYFLGLQYERTSQADKAVEAYEKIPAEAGVYAPAKFHSLTLRGTALLESAPTDATRKAKAAALVQDAEKFHAFIVGFKSPDAAKVTDVRTFGPDVDLLTMQVKLEVLGDYEGARKAALRLPEDWPEAPEQILSRCKVAVIMSYLKEGNTAKVVELVSDVTKLTEDVVSEIVRQLRARVERLDPVAQKAEREEMAKQYAMFAEDIYRRALERFKAQATTQPADWLDKQMYEFTKGLAGAKEESSDSKVLTEALKLYEKLTKLRKDDAVNIRGIARCARKTGDRDKAIQFYNKLVMGLNVRTPDWWQAYAELAEYAADVFAKNPEQLDKMTLVLSTLVENDPAMGGPALKGRFAAAQAKIAAAQAALGAAPAASQPASAPAPAPDAAPTTAPAK